MSDLIARFKKRVQTLFLGFRVRKAKDLTDTERETFERYGEQIVATILVDEARPWTHLEIIHASEQAKINARDWLTERADIQARRDRWIPLRDLILEIIVIGLIGWEIYLGYQQERQQSENFDKQQKILNNLNDSSKATADTLTALKKTTDMELEAMKNSVGVAERSAKASESSATTAAKSLHVSERAYVAVDIVLTPPKAGEKLHFVATMTNAGRTTATDVRARFSFITVPQSITEQSAYDAALALKQDPFTSTSILAAGQRAEQVTDSPNPTPPELLSALSENKMTFYGFFRVSYKDLFNHEHHTVQCSKFDTKLQRLVNCATLSIAD